MHIISEASSSDLVLVRDSWRKSYRHSPGTYAWPQAAYDAWITVRLDELLPRCRVTVLRPADWSEGVLAWVASQQTEDRYVLHWAFCKGPFRREGHVTRLIQEQRPQGPCFFGAKSFHAGAARLANRFGFRFAGASNRK